MKSSDPSRSDPAVQKNENPTGFFVRIKTKSVISAPFKLSDLIRPDQIRNPIIGERKGRTFMQESKKIDIGKKSHYCSSNVRNGKLIIDEAAVHIQDAQALCNVIKFEKKN